MGKAGLRARALVVLSMIAANACAQTTPLKPTFPLPPPPPSPLCDAARYARWIGRPIAEIDLKSAPPAHRVICAECAMTMDYAADRLTIFLDADGKVARLACQ